MRKILREKNVRASESSQRKFSFRWLNGDSDENRRKYHYGADTNL